MEDLLQSGTVPWITPPHRLDTLLADDLPRDGQVTAAFAFVLDSLGRTLLTYVDRAGRGWDLPGGHLDPGETPAEAAARELAEESGLSLPPERLTVFAWHRIELLAPPPPGYGYPPLAYMVMFLARLDEPGPAPRPPTGSECTRAAWLPHADVERLAAGRSWLVAHRALRG